MPEANRALLDALGKKYHLAMCGAGNVARIFNQMEHYPIDLVGNYGMTNAKVENGELVITKDVVTEIDREFFLRETNRLREKYGYTEYAGEPIEWHPSGMVTFALLGTKAKKEDKLVFDRDRAKRRVMFPEVLEVFKDYTVFIGGSTSFDIVGKQYNKYDATMEYAKMHGYTKEQVLFVGDDMGDGGGDSHVRLGGMDYIHILDYTKVAEKMAFLLE
jgi:hydroxymethylpyrimidine pyrophosphatase-like HAD family hydrolase